MARDGNVVGGRGKTPDLRNLALAAVGAAFIHPCGAILYVAGPTDLLWTVDIGLAGPGAGKVERRWGFDLMASGGSRLWWDSSGGMGVGRSVEDVERVYQALHLMAEARARGSVA